MQPTPANWRPPATIPPLDWLRTEGHLVLATLRLKTDIVWYDGQLWWQAEPLTKTGVRSLVFTVEPGAHFAFSALSYEPQFLTPGLFPADAITRNILRSEDRRTVNARRNISDTCRGHIAWLDEPFEDESTTRTPDYTPLPWRGPK